MHCFAPPTGDISGRVLVQHGRAAVQEAPVLLQEAVAGQGEQDKRAVEAGKISPRKFEGCIFQDSGWLGINLIT